MLFSPMKRFLTAFVVVVFSAVSLSPVHSVTVEDEQIQSHSDDSDKFRREADSSNSTEELRATQVEQQSEKQQRERQRKVDLWGQFADAENRCEERSAKFGDRGNRHEHCPGVNPRREPRASLSSEAAHPRIDTAGDGELRDDLAHNKCDEHLTGANDDDPPNCAWASGSETETEQRVNRDER